MSRYSSQVFVHRFTAVTIHNSLTHYSTLKTQPYCFNKTDSYRRLSPYFINQLNGLLTGTVSSEHSCFFVFNFFYFAVLRLSALD